MRIEDDTAPAPAPPLLFCLTGSSGTGKTTIGHRLKGRIPGVVVLERDVLWGAEMDTPDDGYRRFNVCWLRLVADVQASGFSALLCGTTMPYHVERLEERRSIGAIHYMALVCSDEELVERLRSRGPDRAGTT
jgi:broad-specificity NMP kinase